MYIPAGRIIELPVFDSNAQFLMLGDERFHVNLPKRDFRGQLPENGETVKVFTFYNEDRELEATTVLPLIQEGEVASFRIISVNHLGAFVSIGTKRDILIPMREMREQLEQGRLALVTLQVDDRNQRLFGSTRLSAYFKNNTITLQRGDEVDLLVAEQIEIGNRVIINGKNIGVIFRQEMLRPLKEGDKLKGYVRKIEDGEITVSMSKEGQALIDDARKNLLEFLENNNGYIRLNDDSDPEEIKLRLRMSKGTFKKVVGMLYKERKVLITKFGIKLNREENPNISSPKTTPKFSPKFTPKKK
jgi:predicted RNA-binding protein (virulence factor B family)